MHLCHLCEHLCFRCVDRSFHAEIAEEDAEAAEKNRELEFMACVMDKVKVGMIERWR